LGEEFLAFTQGARQKYSARTFAPRLRDGDRVTGARTSLYPLDDLSNSRGTGARGTVLAIIVAPLNDAPSCSLRRETEKRRAAEKLERRRGYKGIAGHCQ